VKAWVLTRWTSGRRSSSRFKKGVSKSETARRFGVDRATVKRYCKQLDERGTLQPRKAPGKRAKQDEKAMRLLAEDLEERPWATHSQRAEFLRRLWRMEVGRIDPGCLVF
jgi:transposase